MADGGLGDVQFLGRLGEAQMPGGSLKRPERIQGWKAAAHLFGSIILIEWMRTDRLRNRVNIDIFNINSHRNLSPKNKIFSRWETKKGPITREFSHELTNNN